VHMCAVQVVRADPVLARPCQACCARAAGEAAGEAGRGGAGAAAHSAVRCCASRCYCRRRAQHRVGEAHPAVRPPRTLQGLTWLPAALSHNSGSAQRAGPAYAATLSTSAFLSMRLTMPAMTLPGPTS
jgi:hypothetical protein